MKKFTILLLALCTFSVAHSQDLTQESQRINDSLQRQVIRPLQESISTLNTTITDLSNQVARLERELTATNNRITEDRNGLSIERDNLDNLQTIKESENRAREQQKYAKGRQSVYNQIAQTYDRPFDELIQSSTMQSVKRDLLLIGNNETARKRLLDLQVYFAAKQLLSERFNEQRVNDARTQLASIEQSALVKELTEKLRLYRLRNDGLKATINRIIDIDRTMTADDDSTQEIKRQHILGQLSRYFREFLFNFTDTPYLSGIVLEIMRLKQRDADAPISHLLDKL